MPAQVLTSELALILHNASLFAHNDDTIPQIASVALESTGTHLVATGTDRFMLGASATPYADEKWTAVLPIEHVKTLLTVLNKINNQWTAAALSLSPQGLRFKVVIAAEEIKFSFPTRARDSESFKYPAWRQLLKDHKVTDSSPSTVSLDAQKLVRFAKVKSHRHAERGSKYMRLSLPEVNKAMQVRIGQHFVGLIMPVRLPSDVDTGEPKWL